MARLRKKLDVARRSQEATNNNNFRKRYANYQRLPQLRTRAVRDGASEEHEHPKDDSSSIAYIVGRTQQAVGMPRSAAQGHEQPRHIHQAGTGEPHGSGQRS